MTEEVQPQQQNSIELSNEGKIPKEPQQTPHNIEVRILAQSNTETPTSNLSQREKTPKRTNKGKGPIVETTSLVKYMSPMGTTLA